MKNKLCCYFFGAVLLFCALFAHSQATVALAPPLHPKFTDNSGQPLAGGFLHSYLAGTSTDARTYADAAGSILNPAAIPLDASGAPTNGSVQVAIYLLNQAYKFCAFDANLVQQWCRDNVSTQLSLLNLSNNWSELQTFPAIILTQTDNQIVVGAAGVAATLDFPPASSAGYTLHFPNSTDTVVGRDTMDTLTNKTLTNALLNVPSVNGVPEIDTPGTYFNIANASPVGTANETLTVMLSGAAKIAPAGATGGVIGITVFSGGTTGTATVQQSGSSFCFFDGATTAGHYVQISASTAGYCTDAGAAYPSSGGQIIGRVLTSNGSSGVYVVTLFGPEIQTPSNPAVASIIPFGGAGSGGTSVCSGFCNDSSGTVVVVTGSSPVVNAQIVAVTFGVTHPLFNCVFAPANHDTAPQTVYLSNGGTNFNLFDSTTALTASTTYVWKYNCQ